MAHTLTSAGPSAAGLDALERWLDAYGAAWEARDGAAAAELFTETARYHWGPFEPVLEGRPAIAERWDAATGDQRDIHFEHAPLAVADGVLVAHWRSTFVRLSTLAHVTLDGIFILEFDRAGLCSQLQEWWVPAMDLDPHSPGGTHAHE